MNDALLEEHTLYTTDRAEWLRQVAPAYARKLVAAGPAAFALAAPYMLPDYRAALREHMTEAEWLVLLGGRTERAA